MDATLVSAMAGVLGSLVGGSATVATAWVTQATLNRRELMIAELLLLGSMNASEPSSPAVSTSVQRGILSGI